MCLEVMTNAWLGQLLLIWSILNLIIIYSGLLFIAVDSKIVCDEFINTTDSVSTNVSKNFITKK